MKQITKIVQQIGNGGHIYLPKDIVGQKVLISIVERSIEDIKEEIMDILKPHLEHICGVYLCGSYARGEQTEDSDIDVLVITDGEVKIKKRILGYEIFSSSIEQIKKTIDYAAVLILPMLKEAKPILNKKLIEEYAKEKLNRKNTKWYIETTESSLKLAKHWISDKDEHSMPYIIYPLVMRLRGLHLIESLVHGKASSNADVMNCLINGGISKNKAEQIYKVYREHRDEKNISENSLNYEDVGRLYDITYKYFQRVKLLWAKPK